MELTLQKSLSRLYIKSFTGKSFIIAEDEYHTNIIIDDKIKRWNINKSELFNFEYYDKIIMSKPDIIIIGCGDTQILPSPNFINNFTSQNIGIEIMTTESACKTFNVLISEHRKVVAGLTL